MNKVKKILTMLFAGISVTLGLAAGVVVLRNQNEIQVKENVKEVKADAPSGHKYFYFTVLSEWNGGNDSLVGDKYWDEQTDNVYTISSSDIFTAAIRSAKAIRI